MKKISKKYREAKKSQYNHEEKFFNCDLIMYAVI